MAFNHALNVKFSGKFSAQYYDISSSSILLRSVCKAHTSKPKRSLCRTLLDIIAQISTDKIGLFPINRNLCNPDRLPMRHRLLSLYSPLASTPSPSELVIKNHRKLIVGSNDRLRLDIYGTIQFKSEVENGYPIHYSLSIYQLFLS